MGIYDREYYREDRGRRGGGAVASGLGRVRMLSVTAWLIIINVVIFVLQLGMGSLGVPVPVGDSVLPGVTEAQLENAVLLTDYFDRPVRADGSGRVLLGAPATTASVKHVGNIVYQYWVSGPEGGRVPVGTRQLVVMDPLSAYGHFSTYTGFRKIEVWRLVTFQFLHASPMHIFFNMFALWIFGPLVEQQLGRKRYLAFYLICGIFGGLMYLLLNTIGALGIPMPGALHVEIYTPLIGASAGVFGVLMACAYIAPKAIVRLLFPPISIQMRWFVYGYFVIALGNLVLAGHNQGGDAAHVGGALAGFFFIRRPHLLRDFFDVFGDSRKKPIDPPASPHRHTEIDAILDKINRDGLASLNDSEKRTLAEHSRRERSR